MTTTADSIDWLRIREEKFVFVGRTIEIEYVAGET